MPVYEFVTSDRQIIEAFYPMDKAPRIGDVVTIEGRRCTRIIRPPQGFARRDVEFASVQVHPKHPAIKKRDAKGRAAFGSRSEVEAFCERTRKLAETVNPNIPVYEFDAVGDTERSDHEGETERMMQAQMLERQVDEALRGLASIKAEDAL